MRAVRFAFSLLAFLAFSAGPAESAPVYALGVDGLSCPFCAYGIEKELSALDGFDKLDIDIETGLITIHMAEGARMTKDQANRIVEDAGFTLRSFEPVSGD